MPLFDTLASLSTTPASNAADGAADAPSTLDDQLNLLASFVAQLRDGSNLDKSIAVPGYLPLAGGLIVQWMNVVQTTSSTGGLTVNYPKPFPTSIYAVVLCNGDTASGLFTCGIETYNVTGVNVGTSVNSQPIRLMVIALGK